MQVASGRRNAGMTECCLDQADRCPPIERMAGVGVPEPVRRYVRWETCSFGCCLDDAEHLRRVQRPTLTTAEHRSSRAGVPAQCVQLAPCIAAEQHHPRLPALAEDDHLPGIPSDRKSVV